MAATAAAVVVAAGRGTRLHGPEAGPKALAVAAGRPLLDLALSGVRAISRIRDVVVVYTPGQEDAFAEVVGGDAVLVPGGDTRRASVRAGVGAVAADVEHVAIHDAARALTPPAVIQRTLEAMTGDVLAAAPGIPLRDTVKRVGEDGSVVDTVDRRGLWAAHTPQVVRREVLDAVFAWDAPRETTDDLGLVERARAAGVVAGRIVLVRGDPRGLKVTYPEDLAVASALVRGLEPSLDER